MFAAWLSRWLWVGISTAALAACAATSSSDSPKASGGQGASSGLGGRGGSGTVVFPDASTSRERIEVMGPGAAADAASLFKDAEPSGVGPELVYPATGVVLPRNMSSLEIHFIPEQGQGQFELSFLTPTLELVVYLGCTPLANGCVYEPGAEFWGQLADASAGVGPVEYHLRGINPIAPGAIGQSETRELSFSAEDIVGGLYYWDASGAIQRYDFGLPGAGAELFLNAFSGGATTCVGCHAMSPNGRKMVVGKDIPSPAPYTVFDVATRQPVQSTSGAVTGAGNFFSFSPDGAQLLYSDGNKIGWRDTTTGNIVNDSVVPLGTMPDWSPNGSQMVYAKPQASMIFGTPGIDSGSIEVIPFSAGVWGASRELVSASGQNNYYPAFAPDNQWIVFNRSPGNQNSYDNLGTSGDGELWAVSAAGGSAVRMSVATEPGACSWPKWAPGIHTAHERPIMYLTFSSSRPYGLRLADGERVQLWMVAFDPGRATDGQDPSFAAFWLPFQDISTGNHIAQWVAEVVRRPCTDKGECEVGEECSGGKCLPVIH